MKIKNQKDTELKVEKTTKAIGEIVLRKGVQSVSKTIADFQGICPKQFVIKEKLTKELVYKKYQKLISKYSASMPQFVENASNVKISLSYIPVFLADISSISYIQSLTKTTYTRTGTRVSASISNEDVSISSTPIYTTGYASAGSYERTEEIKSHKKIHCSTGLKGFFSTTSRQGCEVTIDNYSQEVLIFGGHNKPDIALDAIGTYYMKDLTKANYKLLQLVFFPIWKCEYEYSGTRFISYISDYGNKYELSYATNSLKEKHEKQINEKLRDKIENRSNIMFYLWSWILVCLPLSYGIILLGENALKILITGGVSVVFHAISYSLYVYYTSTTSKYEKDFVQRMKQVKLWYALYIVSFFLPNILIALLMLF